MVAAPHEGVPEDFTDNEGVVSDMSWTETHRRWQALREIEALANAGELDTIPWTPEYAELFGDLDGLVAALRSRWEQTRRAQLDSHLPESVLEEQWRRLRARHAGVLRLVERYDATRNGERDPVPA